MSGQTWVAMMMRGEGGRDPAVARVTAHIIPILFIIITIILLCIHVLIPTPTPAQTHTRYPRRLIKLIRSLHTITRPSEIIRSIRNSVCRRDECALACTYYIILIKCTKL